MQGLAGPCMRVVAAKVWCALRSPSSAPRSQLKSVVTLLPRCEIKCRSNGPRSMLYQFYRK